MEMLILPVLIIFFPHNGLLDKPVCGESKFLSSTIEGQVTLSIDKTIEFKYINWLTTDGKFLAKTSTGKPAQIRQAEYEGRLKATADGSLVIMKLTREDENQYIANVQTIASGQCLQRFHLRVFDALSTESCAGQTNISSEEGTEVTLPVNQTGFVSITWVTLWDLVHFAVTKPGQPVIQDPRYQGRLHATSNGALIIAGLTREDQGTYGAYVVTATSQQCAQLYNLRVTGTLSVESCSGQTNISSEEGTEVTLPVNQTGFVSVTWVTLWDLVHFAVTEPGQPVVIQDPRYKGRLNATANGTLIIAGLTREDQGTYGAYVVTPTSQQCAQLYNLRVTGFYQEKTRMDYTTENTIRLAISGCVLLITCFVLIHHMKTEVMSPSTDTHEHRRCTKVL
ncbi:pregnancy-specific beta-1-glycoprotein 9-like [Rana temporaria]|uniref:pregnancy-specific beta-1-glycoprotein 9-like n=1 Tax=Rana temporaria TaxID=8407 RepID=UPI001AACF7B3|nr:pregnancy-specific beta-1-glycoprotein 9-like [Rana temporaria]